MTSIALKRLGHNVTIFERSHTPLLHAQGAGVVAGIETQDFMSYYDKSCRPITVTSKQRLDLDRTGKVVFGENTVQKMTSWDLLYHLCRVNFDGVESEYLGKIPDVEEEGEERGDYEYARTVTGLEEDENGRVRVSFQSIREDGEHEEGTGPATADLILVADGSSSKMRALLDPTGVKTYICRLSRFPRYSSRDGLVA